MPAAASSVLRLLLCLCLLLGAGCARTPSLPDRFVPGPKDIRDLSVFPQDLAPFAKAAGRAPLLSAQEQEAQAARFRGIHFAPWHRDSFGERRKDVASSLRRPWGWRFERRWTQEEWADLVANADMASFPSRLEPAVTIRPTNLRGIPTHLPLFDKPTREVRDNPFDLNQYSLLPIGTPLLIGHRSRDGKWLYVATPAVSGWMDADAAAPADAAFRERFEKSRLTAFLRDKIALGPTSGTAGIGVILPLISGGSGRTVLVPHRGADGSAAWRELALASGDVDAWPLRMTPAAAARIGNALMGQPYGWGGMFGERDCSAMTRDFLSSFGIWLPRNSSAQARSGVIIPLDDLSIPEKEKVILERGRPFLSLLWLRGHITLYVGGHGGRPAIFHNAWGVRTVDGDDDNARHVIGRAVVTSITPGIELPNLYRKATFGDHIKRLVILPREAARP